MNLYLFPESAILSNGYGIVVNSDYNLLAPGNNDYLIWYTNNHQNPKFKLNHFLLERPTRISFKRLTNMISNKVGSEVNVSELSFLREFKFENIFCGDVVFYRAIRALFPENYITVRFHNCFARINERRKKEQIKVNLKFKLDLIAMDKLENEIFRDNKVYKIFISEEDKDYYKNNYNDLINSVWGVDVNIESSKKSRNEGILEHKLVWFGGVESHKKNSIKWFLDSIFPLLKLKIPDIEIHLWGQRTTQFNNPTKSIYGHGFYDGNDLPLKNKALFINPDIIGGGVKIKLKTYFEEGVPFITTPYGFEGYSKSLIDDKYCIVADKEEWLQCITNLLFNN